MRSGILLIASAVVALGTLELAIRVFDLFAPARVAIVDGSLRAARPAGAPASAKQLHPFWGWTLRKDSKRRSPFPYEVAGHRNLFGFLSTIDDYRDVDESDCAIGIFGGSVAGGVSNWGSDEIATELARAHPELDGRIRILNLASPAYKQPQQLMVLGEMILLGVPIDYVVNVDGLNEVVLGSAGARNGYHPLFPARWEMRALVDMVRGLPRNRSTRQAPRSSGNGEPRSASNPTRRAGFPAASWSGLLQARSRSATTGAPTS